MCVHFFVHFENKVLISTVYHCHCLLINMLFWIVLSLQFTCVYLYSIVPDTREQFTPALAHQDALTLWEAFSSGAIVTQNIFLHLILLSMARYLYMIKTGAEWSELNSQGLYDGKLNCQVKPTSCNILY